MNNEDLKKLIYQIGNKQDKVAFSDIFYFFAPKIVGYLIATGSKQDIAEEITQEVLSVVWQKAGQFDHNKANVSTWVFTIARNKRIDKIRKNNNPSYNTLDLIDALYSNNNDNLNDNLNDKLENIQSKLNENEKKLIRMNFFEGKTHNIISRDLEIPLGTVKSRIKSILSKMRKL